MKPDRSSVVGRRLSKDATFLSSSPPDINSRRSSYLDMISSSSKLAGKSPVLSIENVSDSSSKEHIRKLSDSECIGRKLATLPRSDLQDRNKLQARHSIAIGSCEQESNLNYDTWDVSKSLTKSAQNIPDSEREITVSVLNLPSDQRSNLSDDEIARRNKLTINQLQSKSRANTTNNNKAATSNPPRIRVEDTSKPELPPRKAKVRHKSLGGEDKDVVPMEPKKRRHRITEPSRSLDSKPPRSRSRSRSPRYSQDELPPAPPPPNCSPRNCTGRSPLDRLSKDELVNLWRSSESEIRSHLLKAIRDKDTDKTEDPP